MADSVNALAQLRLARRILATHPGDVRDRLWYAQTAALGLLKPQDFPAHMQNDFTWIREQLTTSCTTAPDPVRGALDGVRTPMAKKIAERICDLCEQFDQWAQQQSVRSD